MAGEIQAGTRFVFSTGADASSQYYYSYVTFFDIIDSFLNFGFFLCGKWIRNDFRFRPVGIYEVTSFGIGYFCTFLNLLFDTFQYGSYFYCYGAVVGKCKDASSAFGPHTAIRLICDLSKGSRLFAFFNSTSPSREACKATC